MPELDTATGEAVMLKPLLVFSALIVFEIAALTPTLAAPPSPQEAAPAPANHVKVTAASQDKAKKLYAVDCTICHGETGDGKTDLAKDMQLNLADWTDPQTLAGKSDQELFNIIRKGKDKMPPEDASRAKDDEVWNLVVYLRSLSKAQPAPAPKPAN
jgi:cytochrome c5